MNTQPVEGDDRRLHPVEEHDRQQVPAEEEHADDGRGVGHNERDDRGEAVRLPERRHRVEPRGVSVACGSARLTGRAPGGGSPEIRAMVRATTSRYLDSTLVRP